MCLIASAAKWHHGLQWFAACVAVHCRSRLAAYPPLLVTGNESNKPTHEPSWLLKSCTSINHISNKTMKMRVNNIKQHSLATRNQPLLTNQYQPTSINTKQHQPTSTNINITHINPPKDPPSHVACLMRSFTRRTVSCPAGPCPQQLPFCACAGSCCTVM